MNEVLSVFDIIGPRMTGPSSSHTAGAVRLGNAALRLLGKPVSEAYFTLYGSFATTGKGHGTDKALIAGVLGMQPDDSRIRDAYSAAKERDVYVSVDYSDEPCRHPNTAGIRLVAESGEEIQLEGESIGGGRILVVEINGLDIETTFDYPTLIVQHKDEPGVIAEVTHVLAQLKVNIAFMRVFRHGKGDDAYMSIETDTPVTKDMVNIIKSLCHSVIKLFAV
ncbi:MAG TPA: L-serine ammonia-lyase, iron-sulfur-dependent subunit beta [Eubacteriales bacterium]|nr:L-serine ammonia-lyase, iron-sulfur-dependent subunit beta [Clostridia bacterium]HRV72529.1 L-serine ammonia-lyase, iron-sulfur-dependent subunit beta [Eubacteriales bacterium]